MDACTCVCVSGCVRAIRRSAGMCVTISKRIAAERKRRGRRGGRVVDTKSRRQQEEQKNRDARHYPSNTEQHSPFLSLSLFLFSSERSICRQVQHTAATQALSSKHTHVYADYSLRKRKRKKSIRLANVMSSLELKSGLKIKALCEAFVVLLEREKKKTERKKNKGTGS